MLGLIIFGTRGVTYGSQTGQFFCPDCGDQQSYRHRRVRRFFTLYFIPLLPLDLLGEYVECQSCSSTYKTSILEYDPRASADSAESEFRQAMRRVLALMSLADGHVDDSEIDAIATILGQLEDREVPRAEIEAELERARAARTDIEDYCREMAGYLNDAGREMVIKAAVLVASADGNFDDAERAALAKMAGALNMSRAHFAGVIAELADAPRRGPPN
jgi:tellurite resistance protein